MVTSAVSAGIVADWLLGEPPARWHPVAGFGQAMIWLERRWYADSHARGLTYAVIGASGAAGAGWAMDRLARGLVGPFRPGRAPTSAVVFRPAGRRGGRAAALTVATYVAVAGRALSVAANDIAEALDAGDLDAARRQLPALVGRDPTGLDSGEIARAVVESVAENTVDAVVAPIFWAAVGGPAAVLAYRAVNTLDAMVGHRTPRYARFGWGSAKADDAAGWVPARLTAILVAVVRPARARSVWKAVRSQAATHPSPNAGVAEAAFAAALDVRLGGVNKYAGVTEHRAQLGWGASPAAADIARAVRLSRHVTAALAVAGVAWPATRRSR